MSVVTLVGDHLRSFGASQDLVGSVVKRTVNGIKGFTQ